MKATEVRARVWFTRGPVWRGRQGWVVHYAVMSGERVILYDNKGASAWPKMLQEAMIRVAALRHMETAGHTLKSYTGGYSLPESGRR